MKAGNHIVWTPRFEVGIPELDADHREMVQRINQIGTLCEEGNLTDALAGLRELRALSTEHFAREEEIVQSLSGQLTSAHIKAHKSRAQELLEVEERIAAETGAHSLDKLPPFLVHWFCRHAIGYDAQIRSYFFQDEPVVR